MPILMPRCCLSICEVYAWRRLPKPVLEEDLKTAFPKKLAFLSQDVILELVRRVSAVVNLETEQAFRHGIEIGLGGIWLHLTHEQYLKLK